MDFRNSLAQFSSHYAGRDLLYFLLHPSAPAHMLNDTLFSQFSAVSGSVLLICTFPYKEEGHITLADYCKQEEQAYREFLSKIEEGLPANYIWVYAESETQLVLLITQKVTQLCKEDAEVLLQHIFETELRGQCGFKIFPNMQLLWTFQAIPIELRSSYTLLKKASPYYFYIERTTLAPLFVEGKFSLQNHGLIRRKVEQRSANIADSIILGEVASAWKGTREILGTILEYSPPSRTAFLIEVMQFIESVLSKIPGQFDPETMQNIVVIKEIFGTSNITQLLENLERILKTAYSRMKMNADSSSNATIISSYRFMITHLSDPDLTACSAAEYAGLSPQLFGARFKKLFHQTPGRFLEEKRIAQVKTYLLNTDYSLNEITKRTGIGSTATLYRLFKKHTGKTPSRYRADLSGSEALPHNLHIDNEENIFNHIFD